MTVPAVVPGRQGPPWAVRLSAVLRELLLDSVLPGLGALVVMAVRAEISQARAIREPGPPAAGSRSTPDPAGRQIMPVQTSGQDPTKGRAMGPGRCMGSRPNRRPRHRSATPTAAFRPARDLRWPAPTSVVRASSSPAASLARGRASSDRAGPADRMVRSLRDSGATSPVTAVSSWVPAVSRCSQAGSRSRRWDIGECSPADGSSSGSSLWPSPSCLWVRWSSASSL